MSEIGVDAAPQFAPAGFTKAAENAPSTEFEKYDIATAHLLKTVMDMQRDFSDLKGSFAELKSDVGHLSYQVEGLKGDVADLRGEMSDLRNEVRGELRSLRADTNASVATLSSSIEGLRKTQVQTLLAILGAGVAIALAVLVK